MPREEGMEWNHVRVIELKDKSLQHKVECKYCKHVFVGGASRIREHFLQKKSSLWGSKVHSRRGSPAACPG